MSTTPGPLFVLFFLVCWIVVGAVGRTYTGWMLEYFTNSIGNFAGYAVYGILLISVSLLITSVILMLAVLGLEFLIDG